MKTKYLIVSVLAAAFALASCEKEPSADNHLWDANLFISFQVDPEAATKTSGATEDDETTEAKISSLRLFLAKCSSAGVPDATAKVAEIGADFIELNSTSNSAEAKVISTDGDYQLLYVIANCPSGLTIDTTSYDAFIGSYSLTNTAAAVGAVWTDNKFMMVNSFDANKSVTGGVTCYNGGVLVDFSNQTNEATVTLERVAAKIIAGQDKFIDFSAKLQKVYGADDDHGYVISAAEIDAWALMNCVNSFNLIQKYTTDSKTFHKIGTSVPDVIVTPSSNDQGTSPYPVVKKNADGTFTSPSGYYYTNPKFTGFDASDEPTYTDLVFVDAGKALYCLENNPPYFPATYTKNNGLSPTPSVSDSKMKGRCTAVIFRAKILLADGFDSGADTEPVGGPGAPGSWDVYPTKAYRTDIDTTIYMYKGKYYADLARLKTDYSTTLGSCSTNDDLRGQGVKVYENGYMYYTYYIAKTEITGCYVPYYCVERNKSYRLTVKAVSGLGDDLPCDYTNYDPEDPVDMAIPKMKVSVDVLPWDEKDPVTYEIK